MSDTDTPEQRLVYIEGSKLVLIVLGGVFAFSQWIANTNQTRINRGEASLARTAERLESPSTAVRAFGIRSLFDIAFRQAVEESEPTPLGPFITAYNWITGQTTLRYRTRSRQLLKQIAQADKERLSPQNPVSTAIGNVARRWIDRETNQRNIKVSDPRLSFYRNADLSSAYIPGINLSSLNLQNVALDAANLASANLTNIYAANGNFASATITAAELNNADLSSARLDSAVLNFSEARATIFRDANLTDASVAQVDFTRANFSDIEAHNTDFTGAVLRHANFSSANLAGATFQQADVSGADFTDAKISREQLEEAVNVDKAKGLDNN